MAQIQKTLVQKKMDFEAEMRLKISREGNVNLSALIEKHDIPEEEANDIFKKVYEVDKTKARFDSTFLYNLRKGI